MTSRNITLTLPAELIRKAKIVAASRDTSVSALVAEFLRSLTQGEDEYDRIWAQEEQIMTEGLAMRVGRVAPTRSGAHER